MTRSNPFKLFAEDPEFEHTTLQNLRVRIRQIAEELGVDLEDTQLENMVEPHRMMFKYTRLSLTGIELSIVKPNVMANNFEIKLNIIQMVQ